MTNYEGMSSWWGEIRSYNFDVLEARVKEANKRARRLKLPELTCGLIPGTERIVKDGRKEIEYVKARITGKAIVLPDWHLLARLDIMFDAETGEPLVTVSKAPGVEDDVLEGLREDSYCDHCLTHRRRKVVYVVQNAKGKRMQVGSKCLMDFLGTDRDPSKLLWFYTLLGSIFDEEAEGWGKGGRQKYEDVDVLLPWVALVIRHKGWTSKSVAWDRGVTSTIQYAQDERARPYREGRPSVVVRPRWPGGPQDEDRELAAKAVAWAKALEPDNDYLKTLNTIARAGMFPLKMDGFAASMVSAYLREESKLKKAALREREWKGWKKDAHTGTVGERQEFKCRMVQEPKGIESDWGTSWLLTFIHLDTGALVKTFASEGIKAKMPEVEVGGVLIVKGTVKRHGSYNGSKETLLSRVAWGKVIRKKARMERARL